MKKKVGELGLGWRIYGAIRLVLLVGIFAWLSYITYYLIVAYGY